MKTFEDLLMDYGDACFACGDYQGDDMNKYSELSLKRAAAYNMVLAHVKQEFVESDFMDIGADLDSPTDFDEYVMNEDDCAG